MERPRPAVEASTDFSDQGFQERNDFFDTADRDCPSRPDPIFPIVLNGRWRVEYDPLQWVLAKRRCGTRWRGNAFCTTRQALLRNIRERCGDIDPDALAEVMALPDWHPDRTRGAP
jgi:hypothetical protein